MRHGIGLALLSLLVFVGCATSVPYGHPGEWRYHVVEPGETLWSISQDFGTSVAAISRANELEQGGRIMPGQSLRIPPRDRRPVTSGPAVWTSSDPRGKGEHLDFDWPVHGRVSSAYGWRKGSHHDGIDIPAPRGTPILASETGRVIHSDSNLRGYGNLIIIKHAGVFTTVYAHNAANYVSVGEFVEQGDVIGEVGSSGNAESPHLHFEIRRDNAPKDPVNFLP